MSQTKQVVVLDAIRKDILCGVYKPGTKLPSQEALAKRFSVSGVTIQRVMDSLASSGIVHALRRSGTYVSETPPHLHHYGIVFPPAALSQWPLFWTILQQQAMLYGQSSKSQVFTYRGSEREAEDNRRLIGDVRSHRLGGLVFTYPPFGLVGTPALDEPGIARVAIISEPLPQFPDLPIVTLSGVGGETFLSKALAYLRSRGRRRVGVIAMMYESSYFEGMIQQIRQAGMTIQPFWVQTFHPQHTIAARNAICLMMHNQAERPDCLLATDDNLIVDVSAGLTNAGVSVPGDVEVVSHCNFPLPFQPSQPFKFLGFDCRGMIETCMSILKVQMQGGRAEMVTGVPYVFDHELKPAGGLSAGDAWGALPAGKVFAASQASGHDGSVGA